MTDELDEQTIESCQVPNHMTALFKILAGNHAALAKALEKQNVSTTIGLAAHFVVNQ